VYTKGQRIELVHMGNDPHPIAQGTKGTVEYCTKYRTKIGEEYQVGVSWDNGRKLAVLLPHDIVRVIDKE
jgi:hypothetical protein